MSRPDEVSDHLGDGRNVNDLKQGVGRALDPDDDRARSGSTRLARDRVEAGRKVLGVCQVRRGATDPVVTQNGLDEGGHAMVDVKGKHNSGR